MSDLPAWRGSEILPAKELVIRSGAVQPQYDDRGDDGLHRPCNHRKAVSHRDLLLAVHASGFRVLVASLHGG
jgi:hypothetical protein